MPGLLTHSPADVMRSLMIDLGLGTWPLDEDDWPIFVSQEADLPDNCITVYDTEGLHQGRVHIDGEVQERHGIQVRVRAVDFVTAATKSSTIVISLDQSVYRELVTIDSSVYRVHAVSRTSGPMSIGKEVPGSKRDVFTINATVSMRQTT